MSDPAIPNAAVEAACASYVIDWEAQGESRKAQFRGWFRAALEAAAPFVGPQWRPIETAPRDSRRILCGFQGRSWISFVALALGPDTWVPGYARPTHWTELPLPPPPLPQQER